MTDGRRHLGLADLVDELTAWHTHVEHYAVREAGRWTGTDYRVKVAPLILQLQFSAMPDNSGAGSSSAFGSRPAARLDERRVGSEEPLLVRIEYGNERNFRMV